MAFFILVGLPTVAVFAFLASSLNLRRYDKNVLSFAFSTLLRDSERSGSTIDGEFVLVNSLTEQDLKNNPVWLQTKL